MAIKYGINTFTFVSPFTTKDLVLLDKAKQMGFDVVEIPIEGTTDIDYAEAARAFKRAGLAVTTCAAMGPDRDPTHEDPAIQQGGVDYLKHMVDATAAMGGTLCGGPIYASVGRTWQQEPVQRKKDLARCAKNLKIVADYARQKGVVFGIEPLNRFETSFINLAAQAVELVEMIDSPAIKIMLDTFHMNIEEKHLGKAIETAAPYLVHVHSNENDRGTPGSGHVPWADVAAALKKVKFDGAMVIESFSAENKTIARAAAIWRPPAPTQDELASEGLKFLKQLMA
jgi:D-psicose/D-tagatose/L-ribulose 3-epimerase